MDRRYIAWAQTVAESLRSKQSHFDGFFLKCISSHYFLLEDIVYICSNNSDKYSLQHFTEHQNTSDIYSKIVRNNN